MLIEVLANFLPLGCFLGGNMGVALLELTVLRLVLPCDLLVLLPDNLSLGATVLMLQSLLVEKLFLSFSARGCGIDGAQKRQKFFGKDSVKSIRAFLNGLVSSITATDLQLTYFRCQLEVAFLKALSLLTVLIRLAWLLLLLLRCGLIGRRYVMVRPEDVSGASRVSAVLVQFERSHRRL